MPDRSGRWLGCAAKHKMIALLWAEDDNGIIGKGGTLPWHLPNDLKYFKEKTLNHKIVMGRKTFEGMGSRPLPKRESIILTRQPTTLIRVLLSCMTSKKYWRWIMKRTRFSSSAAVKFLNYFCRLRISCIRPSFMPTLTGILISLQSTGTSGDLSHQP